MKNENQIELILQKTITKICKKYNLINNINNEDQTKLILQETIVELRRRYDLVSELNRDARLKTITFMGAGFGLFTYLYSGSSISKGDLFIPNEIYGKIIYGLAILLILGAMIRLFLSMGGAWWEFPCHEVKLKDIEDKENDLSFLRYVRNEYLRSTKLNLITYENKISILNTSLAMLSFGGILVVLIKVFN